MIHFLAIALLLVASPCLAEKAGVIGTFRGLHNSDASILIGDNEAQDLQDVDITESGFGIRKRPGYSQFKTVGVSTHGVRGMYFFRDASGNDNIIATNETDIYYSRSGGAFTAFVTTDTSGGYYDFTDSNGTLWRVNSNRDEVCSWNGTTRTYYPDHPKGNQVEVLPDRLVISGTSANPGRINYSAKGDFTNFTVGNDDTSPWYENPGLPGQGVTAIKSACGGLLAWTETTCMFGSGDGQNDYRWVKLSGNVGTKAPGTVIQDNGITFWQGQDNTFYSYDCNVISEISKNVDTSKLSDGSGGTGNGNWSVTSTGEFSEGTAGDGLTISDGSVYFDDYTLDDFSDGDFSSDPVWTERSSGTGDVSVSNEELVFVDPAVNDRASVYTTIESTGLWSIQARTADTQSATELLFIQLCNTTPPISAPLVGCFNFGIYNTGMDISVDGSQKSTLTSTAGRLTSTSKKYSVEKTAGNVLNLFVDDTLYISYTSTITLSGVNKLHVLWYSILDASENTLYVDDVKYKYPLAAYQSPSQATTGATSFGGFSADSTLNGGAISYTLYVDTDSATTPSDSTTYTSSETVTSGTTPSSTPGGYAVIVADFSRSVSTYTASLDYFSLAWFGSSSPRHYGTIDSERRLIWSVSDNNSYVSYIYDQEFDSWLKYSFPFYAPVLSGETSYFGGVSTGVVYSWPSGNSDDGDAITSYWKSKDFTGSDPFTESKFKTYSFFTKTQTGSNLDFTYTVNTSDEDSENFSLSDANGVSYRRINDFFPSGTFGSFINFKFGNDDADAPFELYGFIFDYEERSWRVME